MPRLTALKGIPGSGKSTSAREMVKKSGYGKARINRDDLRAMIYDSFWNKHLEKHIIGVEKAIAKYFLENGIPVIVDDTNFRNVWPQFVQDCNRTSDYDAVSYEEILIDTPLEECIRRDAARPKPIGRNVITKMALRNGLVKFPDLPIVLVDVDGTTAMSVGRERHLKDGNKDWKSYYEELESDVPIIPIFKKVKDLSDSGHLVIIVSGRGAEWEERTIAWFEKVWELNPLFPELNVPKFPVFLWLFRDAGDHRDDTIVKKEVLDILPKHKITQVLDDRPKVCRMWEEEGLNVEWVRSRDLEDF